MQIEYVGKKPSRADNVAGTGLVWMSGQAHEVASAEACAKLLKHTDVWRIADVREPAEPPQAESAGPVDDAQALRAELDAKGIKYHHKAGVEKLRALLTQGE